MNRGSIVVTGAAGGIGSAIVERLNAEGYTTIGLDLEEAQDATHHEIVDLTDLSNVEALSKELSRRHRIVGMVHCAAMQPISSTGGIDPGIWIKTMSVNMIACDILVSGFMHSLNANRGSVVAVSSVHGTATTGGMTAYATSKSALNGWVHSAALDLAPHIRVNGVVPGATDTSKLREGLDRWPPAEAAARLLSLESRTALGRVARPSEIANVVYFLLSDQASFVTGTLIRADGGALARLGSE
jgi:NAD(P)-dependent dehydrogenase (short-subunit alcohol dehydrogenase family)